MYSQYRRPEAEGPDSSQQKQIRFRVLGALTVQGEDGRTVPLPGTKERAVLAYLLLHPNEVVATSQLVGTLWPRRRPATARKMVQNAVSALRTRLAQGGAPADGVVLLTHAPGYLLRVDPDLIDLHRARRLAEQGRREMAAGSPAAAAELLRQALAQWSGTVLADLVEGGAAWPELAAVAEERQVMREDRFDAELSCGRHHQILGELRLLAKSDPLNERLCAHLMVALYRSGKQADALDAYRRQRELLAAKFGSEPTQKLRDLQRAVLAQDPALDPPAPGAPDRVRPFAAGQTTPAPPLVTEVSLAPDPVPVGSRDAVADGHLEAVARHPDADGTRAGYREGEVKRLSAVLVRAGSPAQDVADEDAETFGQYFREASAVVVEEAERHGGIMAGQIGSTRLMLFGLFRSRVDDALRAVRAGHAVHERLLSIPSPAKPGTAPSLVRVAVATGDALVRLAENATDTVPTVVGALLDRCLFLLESTRSGSIRVCDATRRAADLLTDDALSAVPVPASPATPGAPPTTVPLVEREADLAVFNALLKQAVRTDRPHQITVLGEPGAGKSRLVDEFAQIVREQYQDTQLLRLRIPVSGRTTGPTALGELISLCAGLQPSDTEETTEAKLNTALERWLGSNAPARTAVLTYLPLLVTGPCTRDTTADAFRNMLAAIAAEKPLVLILDDLHRADDSTLDVIRGLAESTTRVPLLVVTTARLDLIDRRPDWSDNGYRTMTIMRLDPLSEYAAARLATSLWGRWGVTPGIDVDHLTAMTGGNPLFVTEYAAMFRPAKPGTGQRTHQTESGRPPERVQAVITEHIDTLHPQAKAVLRDASVQGARLWPEAVAAVGQREVADSRRWLDHLEQRHFLVRADRSSVPGSAEYAFRSAWVREVAQLSVLQSARLEGRRRADAWLAVRLPEHR